MASAGKKWEPRALKKRATEFNVDGPAAPAPAPAPTAASATATPAWGGAGDLDELPDDDSTRPAKQARTEGGGASGGGDSSSAAAPGAPASTSDPDPDRDEIAEAAPRLAQHIRSAAKFNKVAAMAFSLIDGGRVTRANAPAFFTVLEAGISDANQLRDATYRVAYKRLYRCACDHAELFPPSHRATLRLWSVRVLAQLDLFTDDTFQFSRASATIRESLEQLPCVYPSLEPPGAKHLDPDERGPWADALFDCVQTAVSHYKYLWAKTSIDMLVRHVVDRRNNFSDEQQAQLTLAYLV